MSIIKKAVFIGLLLSSGLCYAQVEDDQGTTQTAENSWASKEALTYKRFAFVNAAITGKNRLNILAVNNLFDCLKKLYLDNYTEVVNSWRFESIMEKLDIIYKEKSTNYYDDRIADIKKLFDGLSDDKITWHDFNAIIEPLSLSGALRPGSGEFQLESARALAIMSALDFEKGPDDILDPKEIAKAVLRAKYMYDFNCVEALMGMYHVPAGDKKFVERLVENEKASDLFKLSALDFNAILEKMKTFSVLENVEKTLMSNYKIEGKDQPYFKAFIKGKGAWTVFKFTPGHFWTEFLAFKSKYDYTSNGGELTSSIPGIFDEAPLILTVTQTQLESAYAELEASADLSLSFKLLEHDIMVARNKDKLKFLQTKVARLDYNISDSDRTVYVEMMLKQLEDIVAVRLDGFSTKMLLVDYLLSNDEDNIKMTEYGVFNLRPEQDLVRESLLKMAQELFDNGKLCSEGTELLADKGALIKMMSVLGGDDVSVITSTLKDLVLKKSEGQANPAWKSGLSAIEDKLFLLNIYRQDPFQSVYDLAKKDVLEESDLVELIDNGKIKESISNAKTSRDLLRIETVLEKISPSGLGQVRLDLLTTAVTSLGTAKLKMNAKEGLDSGSKDAKNALCRYVGLPTYTDTDVLISSALNNIYDDMVKNDGKLSSWTLSFMVRDDILDFIELNTESEEIISFVDLFKEAMEINEGQYYNDYYKNAVFKEVEAGLKEIKGLIKK
ncbi:MAG: hypothetical protein WCQ53_03070 [bacterium]